MTLALIKYLVARALLVALAWPQVWYKDGHRPETAKQYKHRVGIMVKGATLESRDWSVPPRTMLALVLTQWRYETGLDYYVHAGLESPIGHQDHGKSRCLGQIQRFGMSKAEWLALTGTDLASTRRCAHHTARILDSHIRRCRLHRVPFGHAQAAIAISAYGRGNGCTIAPWAQTRARMFVKVRGQLQ